MSKAKKIKLEFVEEEISASGSDTKPNDESEVDEGSINEDSNNSNDETEENTKNAGLLDPTSDINKVKKRKKGIIYVSNIPKHMNVTRIREILGGYGKIGRVFLQPEKLPATSKTKKPKKKRIARHFTEGWVEFESKRVAKQVAEFLNNKQISTQKKSQFFDNSWVIKYLPRFKWVHLNERLNYETAVHKQRLRTEISQARKETTFFQNNLDKSEYLKKKNKKIAQKDS